MHDFVSALLMALGRIASLFDEELDDVLPGEVGVRSILKGHWYHLA